MLKHQFWNVVLLLVHGDQNATLFFLKKTFFLVLIVIGLEIPKTKNHILFQCREMPTIVTSEVSWTLLWFVPLQPDISPGSESLQGFQC